MTISELRQICQPAHKRKTDPLMEWYLLRPISIYFTWVFIRLYIPANVVTFLGMLLGLSGGGLLMLGGLKAGLAGSVLLWLSFLFDCVDGEVARYQKKGSIEGTYLDYFAGGINDLAILLGLSFYVSLSMDWDPRLIVGLGVFLAYVEKIIGLYAQSVVYRNIRSYWDRVSEDTEYDYAGGIWKELSLLQRLIRVPFETFFRTSLILLAFLGDWLFEANYLIVAAWGAIQVLGWTLVIKSFYSEFFGKRVVKSMEDFIGALKTSGR